MAPYPVTATTASRNCFAPSGSNNASPGLIPRTNGKAERFIQTALREWAYGRTCRHSSERTGELEAWLHDYNFHRPHSSLGLKTPASRAGLYRNDLLMLHT